MRPALIGKILGGVGLVLLLSSPYTLFITTGSSWLAALKALAGVALIGVYFGTNYGQLGQFASRKSSFFIASTALMGVFLIAALVAVNYVATTTNSSARKASVRPSSAAA